MPQGEFNTGASWNKYGKKPEKPYKSYNGIWYTQSLFWERSRAQISRDDTPEHDPVFSLYDDKPGLINARKTFVSENDPTGWKWCMKYLGDWDQWTKLLKCKWFAEAFEIWRDELKTKVQSEALDRLREISVSESPQALQAAKFLATFEWERKTRGRPSKAELDAEMRRLTNTLTEEDDDAQRIGLKVIQGGKK